MYSNPHVNYCTAPDDLFLLWQIDNSKSTQEQTEEQTVFQLFPFDYTTRIDLYKLNLSAGKKLFCDYQPESRSVICKESDTALFLLSSLHSPHVYTGLVSSEIFHSQSLCYSSTVEIFLAILIWRKTEAKQIYT